MLEFHTEKDMLSLYNWKPLTSKFTWMSLLNWVTPSLFNSRWQCCSVKRRSGNWTSSLLAGAGVTWEIQHSHTHKTEKAENLMCGNNRARHVMYYIKIKLSLSITMPVIWQMNKAVREIWFLSVTLIWSNYDVIEQPQKKQFNKKNPSYKSCRALLLN